jgi:diacylglycerol kinase (ATP)
VIVNARAGGGAAHTVYRRVEHAINDVVGLADVIFTQGPGHAIELAAAAAARGAERVLVCGGDGTVNEVVNGLLKGAPAGSRPTLCVLSGGTGGDLRRTLGTPSVRDSLDLLAKGQVRTIDVGRVTAQDVETDLPFTRHFINVASFGLGGLVDRHVHAFSALGGRAAYGVATALSLWGWKNPLIRLQIEGAQAVDVEMRAVTVAIANGRFFGGGMCVAPDAIPNDGLLDVTIIGDLRRRDLIRASATLYGTDGLTHPAFVSKKATRVTAESDDRVLLDIDGEPLGCLPATFELEPDALTVVSA